MPKMSCPKCRAAMEPVTFEDITVDRCSACGGLWFDLVEHRQLRRLSGSALIDTGKSATGWKTNEIRDVHCPRCTGPLTHMRDVDRHDIEYDYCSVCNGMFFDAGEFARYRHKGIFETIRSLFSRDDGT